MDTLKVATLIEALGLVGQVYRTRDGSRPAEAVGKLLAQLSGAGEMTLGEWARARRAGPKAASVKGGKPRQADAETLDRAIAHLGAARTQQAVDDALAAIALSAGEWRALGKRLTGRLASSGKAARIEVGTHFSDRLLLDERIGRVRRHFG